MTALSRPTRERVRALFSTRDAREAERLLAEGCAQNLPSMQDATPVGLERLRFAAIRLSSGHLGRLREVIQLAQTDWRDLLMCAGFGDDAQAHERWKPRPLDETLLDGWVRGIRPEGVAFLPKARVRVTGGAGRGKHGAVMSLLALEPEPRYLVGLPQDGRVEALQAWLQPEA